MGNQQMTYSTNGRDGNYGDPRLLFETDNFRETTTESLRTEDKAAIVRDILDEIVDSVCNRDEVIANQAKHPSHRDQAPFNPSLIPDQNFNTDDSRIYSNTGNYLENEPSEPIKAKNVLEISKYEPFKSSNEDVFVDSVEGQFISCENPSKIEDISKDSFPKGGDFDDAKNLLFQDDTSSNFQMERSDPSGNHQFKQIANDDGCTLKDLSETIDKDTNFVNLNNAFIVSECLSSEINLGSSFESSGAAADNLFQKEVYFSTDENSNVEAHIRMLCGIEEGNEIQLSKERIVSSSSDERFELTPTNSLLNEFSVHDIPVKSLERSISNHSSTSSTVEEFASMVKEICSTVTDSSYKPEEISCKVKDISSNLVESVSGSEAANKKLEDKEFASMMKEICSSVTGDSDKPEEINCRVQNSSDKVEENVSETKPTDKTLEDNVLKIERLSTQSCTDNCIKLDAVDETKHEQQASEESPFREISSKSNDPLSVSKETHNEISVQGNQPSCSSIEDNTTIHQIKSLLKEICSSVEEKSIPKEPSTLEDSPVFKEKCYDNLNRDSAGEIPIFAEICSTIKEVSSTLKEKSPYIDKTILDGHMENTSISKPDENQSLQHDKCSPAEEIATTLNEKCSDSQETPVIITESPSEQELLKKDISTNIQEPELLPKQDIFTNIQEPKSNLNNKDSIESNLTTKEDPSAVEIIGLQTDNPFDFVEKVCEGNDIEAPKPRCMSKEKSPVVEEMFSLFKEICSSVEEKEVQNSLEKNEENENASDYLEPPSVAPAFELLPVLEETKSIPSCPASSEDNSKSFTLEEDSNADEEALFQLAPESPIEEFSKDVDKDILEDKTPKAEENVKNSNEILKQTEQNEPEILRNIKDNSKDDNIDDVKDKSVYEGSHICDLDEVITHFRHKHSKESRSLKSQIKRSTKVQEDLHIKNKNRSANKRMNPVSTPPSDNLNVPLIWSKESASKEKVKKMEIERKEEKAKHEEKTEVLTTEDSKENHKEKAKVLTTKESKENQEEKTKMLSTKDSNSEPKKVKEPEVKEPVKKEDNSNKNHELSIPISNEKEEKNDWTQEKSELSYQLKNLNQTQKITRFIVKELINLISRWMEDCRKENVELKECRHNLIYERDQAIEDLRCVENAFSDLHRRYEKSKTLVEDFKENETRLIQQITEGETKLKQQQEMYKLLKKRSEEKLEEANAEIVNIGKSKENEITVLKAQLRKAEMKANGLEKSLEQKMRENTELSSICEDLIAKVGKK